MNTRLTTLIAILIIPAVLVVVEAKQWRGIIPLHSTRTDVERLLGNASPRNQLTTYQTEQEAVSVLYASGPPCGSDADSEWNVPKDTVVSITVAPKNRVLLSELKIDLSTYDQLSDVHRPNIITYLNNQDGIRIETFQDEINSVSYFPSAADLKLNCAPKGEGGGDDAIYSRFEDYSANTSHDKVREILDAFAQHLKSNPSLRAFLISYGGKRSCRNEALLRAQLATQYLSKMRGIKSNRFTILNGGYREDWVVEL